MDSKDDDENTNYRPTFDELRDTNILSGSKNSELAPNSVFIAFHQSDQQFAKALKYALSDNQRKIWIDFQDANLSADWLDAIHKGIENTDVFIFVLSPNSNESRACSFQLEHAVKNGKRVIPVCCKPVNYRKVIKELAVLNWIVYNPDGSDYKESQKLLYNTVEAERLHVQYHTKILRRAIEWERHDFEKSLLLRGKDLERSQHWLSAAALGREPKPTTLHLSFITASASLDASMGHRRVIALFFAVIVTIGIIWPSWGVFFFSLVFSHFFVYFSSS
jgi:hypothetical protein